MINFIGVEYVVISLILLFTLESFSQELLEIGEHSVSDTLVATSLRSKNAISLKAGSALLNGDFKTSEFEQFIELKYKRFATPNLAVNIDFKKFDIESYDFKEDGFLSGDLNAEWLLFPQKKFTPFVFAGPGVILSNNFEDKILKVQGGVGLDYMVTTYISLTGSLEVDYMIDEQNDSLLLREADGLFYNASIGIQFYFGNRKTINSVDSKDKNSTIQLNRIDEGR